MDRSPAVGNYHYLTMSLHRILARSGRKSANRDLATHTPADLAALTLSEVPALRQIAAKDIRKLHPTAGL